MFILNIPRKLYILVVLAGVGLVAISGVALTYQYDAMYKQRIDRLRLMTEAAANLIDHHRKRAETGQMSPSDARAAAFAAVSAMRHGQDGYIFVFDRDGLTLAHGDPKIIGRNFTTVEDTTGFRFVADVMPRAVREGVATVLYTWKRTPEAEASPKISLFRHYEPWDLHVATGVHIEDLREALLLQVKRLGGVALGLLILLGIVSSLVIRSIVRPMENLRRTMGELAAGRTDLDLPETARRDEIGAMAAAVAVFRDNAIERARLEGEQEADRALKLRRSERLNGLIHGFEGTITGIVGAIGGAASELQATASTMAGTAHQTAGRSVTVAAAAEQATTNVNTVAAAAEELGASVQEIGRQVDGSAALARAAVDEANRTATLVNELSAAALRIGDVVAMISAIAGQTNLLALNATI